MDIEAVRRENPKRRMLVVLVYVVVLIGMCSLAFLMTGLRIGDGGRIPIDFIVELEEHLLVNSSVIYV
jgi:hypothetical protein